MVLAMLKAHFVGVSKTHTYDNELENDRRTAYRRTVRLHYTLANDRPKTYSRTDVILDAMSTGKFGVREAIALTERK